MNPYVHVKQAEAAVTDLLKFAGLVYGEDFTVRAGADWEDICVYVSLKTTEAREYVAGHQGYLAAKVSQRCMETFTLAVSNERNAYFTNYPQD